jgi:hypothetical protein
VLHWLTSKDNASTTRSGSLPPLESPKRLVPRPPLAKKDTSDNLGLQDYDNNHPNVVTSVTACKDRNDIDVFERTHPFPPNAITVSRNMVWAVDDMGQEKAVSEISTNDGIHRTRSRSEDGLFTPKC